MSALDDVLDEVEHSGDGGGADFWSVKKEGAGKHRVRLYRFDDGEDKEVVRIKRKHFPEANSRPVTCDFPEDCKYCKTSEALLSVNDRESQKQGRQMRQAIEMGFIIVLVDKPDSFKLWGASQAQGKNVMVQVAKSVGWSGPYPNKSRAPSEEAFAKEMEQFKSAVAEGLTKVCGPKGMDICVTYNPSADPKDRYVIDLVYGDGKALSFEENEDVPDPTTIWKRVENAGN